MIISEAVGSIGIYEYLYNLISPSVSPAWQNVFKVIIDILGFIASWGGGAVILGAILVIIHEKLRRLGKWLVGIGLTFGSLALIIWFISNLLDWINVVSPTIESYIETLEGFFTYNTGLQFIGVTIAIFGRLFIRKTKKEKEEEEEIKELEISEGVPTINESTLPLMPSENRQCPNCGAQLPSDVSYCTECGATIDIQN
ncbi:MAG: zinc ribbon domain-containing protein [Candidatus Thorarchaeota archaeon]